jgi:acetyl esterase
MGDMLQDVRTQLSRIALRLPLSWISVLTGPTRNVDGFTLDTRTQWLLKLIASSGHPPLEQMALHEARAEFAMSMRILGGRTQPIGELVDRTIEGPNGRIPIRIFRPENAAARPRGILVYFHGGGWTIGDVASYDKPCRYLAAKSGCIVISVGYRLSPEAKFPAAIDDCLAAFRWVAANAEMLGGRHDCIAIGGDSAGGNLAAVCSILLRDAGGPKPAFQLLIYPSVDMVEHRPSYDSCGRDVLLTITLMEWFTPQYLANEQDARDWRASPMRAPDLAALPPAFLCTAGFDPLRDEGKAYADRLHAAGVTTVYRNFESLIHGFVGFTGTIAAAARAMDEIAFALRQGLACD